MGFRIVGRHADPAPEQRAGEGLGSASIAGLLFKGAVGAVSYSEPTQIVTEIALDATPIIHRRGRVGHEQRLSCLLYTSDAADE